MFTGIIEEMARVRDIEHQGDNIHLTLESNISHELYVDQSIAHNGACLTVTDVQPPLYKVTLIQETLHKTNFQHIRINEYVNIERSIRINGRLDGHFVSGHIDTTGTITKISDRNGSYELWIQHPQSPYFITVPKGNIAINGISLTVVESLPNAFSVHIIPYTYTHTNIQYLKEGSIVNLEFDLLGKYIAKQLSLQQKQNPYL